MSWIEALAVAFGVVSVYLSVRQNVWSWPTAIVNVALYVVVFHRARLYADMGLQVVYVGVNAYGWYQWLYGGAGRTELRVSRTSARLGVLLLALGAAFAVGLGTLLARSTDAAIPYLDSLAASTSLVAQWMLTRKKLENWLVWVAVDVVYVAMFLSRGLYLTAGLYAVFLVLATLGYLEWRRELAPHAAALTPPHPVPPSPEPS
ncbi:MAG TPA: nicotinamide riboside transporter PnuC [Longimicrobiaceae bacterium]